MTHPTTEPKLVLNVRGRGRNGTKFGLGQTNGVKLNGGGDSRKPEDDGAGQDTAALESLFGFRGFYEPSDVPPIDAQTRLEFAKSRVGDVDDRSDRFRTYAEKYFRSKTGSIETITSKRAGRLGARLQKEEKAQLELIEESNQAKSVELAQSDAGCAGEPPEGPNGDALDRTEQPRSINWLKKTFALLKPHHQFKVGLLGTTAVVLSTVGASSILQFLTDNSDLYAQYPLLALPLMVIPPAAGLGGEIYIENLKSARKREIAEGVASFICLASFGGWVVGLIDMAASTSFEIVEPGLQLPEGFRAACQIVFECSAITLISGSIFKTFKEYLPDDYAPAAKHRALVEAKKERDADVIEPLARDIERAEYLQEMFEAERDAFVEKECASFAAICADYDRINPQA